MHYYGTYALARAAGIADGVDVIVFSGAFGAGPITLAAGSGPIAFNGGDQRNDVVVVGNVAAVSPPVDR